MSAIVLTKIADPYKDKYVYRYLARTTNRSNWVIDLDDRDDEKAIQEITKSCEGLGFEKIGLHMGGSVYIESALDGRINHG